MRKYKMNILKKFALAGAGAAIATLGVTYAPAAAQQGGYYIYEYTYYSDASKTEQVGLLPSSRRFENRTHKTSEIIRHD